MDFLSLLIKTVALRPYVFAFLAISMFCAQRLLGWRRTAQFFYITWLTALLCELSSTRTGIPFGWYQYTMSTVGQELYFLNVPFMDSLSFIFLLYASYCMALGFLLPAKRPSAPGGGHLIALRFDRSARTSWPVLGLAVLFYALIDTVIDPMALRGDRWFLGHIYSYPEAGVHFGVPLTNYAGWAIVGLISLGLYFTLDRRSREPTEAERSGRSVTGPVLLGCGLHYGVLAFSFTVTFWIGEFLLGTVGILMYIPITVLLALRFIGRLPSPETRS